MACPAASQIWGGMHGTCRVLTLTKYVLHTAIRRRALASAAMVEELTTELRRVLCNYRFG